jgi:hypothetical protein
MIIPRSKTTSDESKILSRSKAKRMLDLHCAKMFGCEFTQGGVGYPNYETLQEFIDQIYDSFNDLDCEESTLPVIDNDVYAKVLKIGYNQAMQKNKQFKDKLNS